MPDRFRHLLPPETEGAEMRPATPSQFVKACKSPIERLFAQAFLKRVELADAESDWRPELSMPFKAIYPHFNASRCAYSFIAPQVRVNADERHCIADFYAVCVGPVGVRVIAIECDGKEWHAKSESQVTADKRRDRELLERGIATVRFSGSELHKNADECASYVYQLMNGAIADLAWEFEVAKRLIHGR